MTATQTLALFTLDAQAAATLAAHVLDDARRLAGEVLARRCPKYQRCEAPDRPCMAHETARGLAEDLGNLGLLTPEANLERLAGARRRVMVIGVLAEDLETKARAIIAGDAINVLLGMYRAADRSGALEAARRRAQK